MSQVCLSDVKQLLDKYPPNLFIKPPEVCSIDNRMINENLQKEAENPIKQYLKAITNLIKNSRHTDNLLGVKQWLSAILEVLNALENIIHLCDNISLIYQDEMNWVKGLAIQRMIDIIGRSKEEITILKAQLKHPKQYFKIREQAYNLILGNLANLLDILLATILVEREELPATKIISIIGKDAGSQICLGA